MWRTFFVYLHAACKRVSHCNAALSLPWVCGPIETTIKALHAAGDHRGQAYIECTSTPNSKFSFPQLILFWKNCFFFLLLLLFLKHSFSVYLWLFWNSLCRCGWPRAHIDLPGSASMSTGIKGVCHHLLAKNCILYIAPYKLILTKLSVWNF